VGRPGARNPEGLNQEGGSGRGGNWLNGGCNKRSGDPASLKALSRRIETKRSDRCSDSVLNEGKLNKAFGQGKISEGKKGERPRLSQALYRRSAEKRKD